MVSFWLMVLLLFTMLGNALLAGTYHAFAIAIRPAYKNHNDEEYVTGFRRINAAILNPGFLVFFFITPLATAFCAMAFFRSWQESWPWAAATAFSLASFLISVTINVPLNNLLASRAADTAWQHRRARRQYESPWNRWNFLRMLCNIAAVLLLTTALVMTD